MEGEGTTRKQQEESWRDDRKERKLEEELMVCKTALMVKEGGSRAETSLLSLSHASSVIPHGCKDHVVVLHSVSLSQ